MGRSPKSSTHIIVKPGDNYKATSKPYLRQPSLSSDGSQVAFCHGGDIWMCSSTGGRAYRITSHRKYDFKPIFSPDNQKLAFGSLRSGGGNIYVADLEGSTPPRRITHHHGSAPPTSWSPDGKWIYFSSNYDGIGHSIYRIGIDGGSPIRLAGEPCEELYNAAVSPGGTLIAFNNNGDKWWRKGPNPAGHSDIWLRNTAHDPRNYERLTHFEGRNLHPMWAANGKRIYYLSDRGGVENIWSMAVSGDKRAKQATHFENGRVLRPSISRNGEWIVFEREFAIWILNTKTGDVNPIDIQVTTDLKMNPRHHFTASNMVDELRLSPDGKKVAYITYGDVLADLSDKGEKSQKGGHAFHVTDSHDRESQLRWLPDSKRVVYLSDRTGNNEVWLYDFQKKKEKRLTDSLHEKHNPKPSPDGKWLAYIQGDSEIRLLNLKTGKSRAFISGQQFVEVPHRADYVWSPDSQWIAFLAHGANYFCNAYVQKIGQRKPRQVSFLSNIDADSINWSNDGKFLLFNTGQYRTEGQIVRVDLVPPTPIFKEDDFEQLFVAEKPDKKKADDKKKTAGKNDESKKDDKASSAKPEPVEIDFENIRRRFRFLTDLKLNAHVRGIRPDSSIMIYTAVVNGREAVWSMNLKPDTSGERAFQIYNSSGHKWGVNFTRDGKKLYFIDSGTIKVLELNEDGSRKNSSQTLSTRAILQSDFQVEKLQAFNEAWRLIRDYFYDPSYHGCDWSALYSQYVPLVASVSNAFDFREIVNLMLGELNASHLGAFGWGSGDSNSYMGVTFDPVVLEKQGHYRIKSVLPESPLTLGKKPAKPGDYIVSINDVRLNASVTNLAELLQWKMRKKVSVRVNTRPVLKGARRLWIQPMSRGQYEKRHYTEWVRQNLEYVEKKSDGRLGYVHIREMSYPAYLKFVADLDTEMHSRDAIIIDVRFNGGGHIAPFIIDVLQRNASVRRSFRGHYQTSNTNLAGGRILEKPVILVTNEHSGSNTEIFSEEFRRLGLGKIVGTPTAGAVIGTVGWMLLDGTTFRLPRFRASTIDGENTEGTGRPVDIHVERALGESEAGVDSQLDVAVVELLKEV